MRYFLTLLEGPSPSQAEPILATDDELVIRRVVAVLRQRLAPAAGSTANHSDEMPGRAEDSEIDR